MGRSGELEIIKCLKVNEGFVAVLTKTNRVQFNYYEVRRPKTGSALTNQVQGSQH